jgi:hypothetical protein
VLVADVPAISTTSSRCLARQTDSRARLMPRSLDGKRFVHLCRAFPAESEESWPGVVLRSFDSLSSGTVSLKQRLVHPVLAPERRYLLCDIECV